jgi:hypothetical protein
MLTNIPLSARLRAAEIPAIPAPITRACLSGNLPLLSVYYRLDGSHIGERLVGGQAAYFVSIKFNIQLRILIGYESPGRYFVLSSQEEPLMV